MSHHLPSFPHYFHLTYHLYLCVVSGILRERNNLPKPVSDKTCSRAFKMRNHHK